jgi:hypothetical protein
MNKPDENFIEEDFVDEAGESLVAMSDEEVDAFAVKAKAFINKKKGRSPNGS